MNYPAYPIGSYPISPYPISPYPINPYPIGGPASPMSSPGIYPPISAPSGLPVTSRYVFRHISPANPVVVFQGLDSTECEEFIHAIRSWAFNQGKYHDDAWMADLAATRMVGKALRWVTTLSDETVKSWKLMQKALLEKYPASEAKDQPAHNAEGAVAVVAAKDSHDSDEEDLGLFE